MCRCIVSPSFLSLPISVWMDECYLAPHSVIQRLHPTPLLSLMLHFGHNESPSIMALWLSWIITDNGASLIRCACIWLNNQQMLTLLSADNLTLIKRLATRGNRPQAWMRFVFFVCFFKYGYIYAQRFVWWFRSPAVSTLSILHFWEKLEPDKMLSDLRCFYWFRWKTPWFLCLWITTHCLLIFGPQISLHSLPLWFQIQISPQSQVTPLFWDESMMASFQVQ